MTYIRHLPTSPLRDYIYYFEYLDGWTAHPREKVFPLPSLDLKINLGGAPEFHELNRGEPFAAYAESWVVGVWDRCHIVTWPPDSRLYGVRFKSHGAFPFLRLPLIELHNRVVPLDAIWPEFAALRDRLNAAPTVQAGFALLEQSLLEHLSEIPHGLAIVQHANACLARRQGALSIHALSEDIGISQNHLGTLFKRMIGIPPKELARFHRFEHVLRSIDPAQPVDWTRIAHQSNYYDLSHLNKEFAAFVGHSPSDYLLHLRHASGDRLERGYIPKRLPID